MPATLKQLVSIESQTVRETLDYLDERIAYCSKLLECMHGPGNNGTVTFEAIRQTVQMYDKTKTQ